MQRPKREAQPCDGFCSVWRRAPSASWDWRATPTREFHGRGHGGHGGGHPAYFREHGHRFSGGYYYSRHEHPVWGRREWDAHFRRWQYWDPYLSVWYYWYPAGNCYYPISYCP